MGMLLLRESMFDSIIKVRDRYLKEDGTMWPSHATVLGAAVSLESDRLETVESIYYENKDGWTGFEEEMLALYDIDVSALHKKYDSENEEYYVYQTHWRTLHPSDLVGPPQELLMLDLKTATLEDVGGVALRSFVTRVPELHVGQSGKVTRVHNRTVSGAAFWFTADFNAEVGIVLLLMYLFSTDPNPNITLTPTLTLILTLTLFNGPHVLSDSIFSTFFHTPSHAPFNTPYFTH